MDHLGITFEAPTKNKKGNWNSIDIFYKTEEEFCEATSKLINMCKSPDGDGKCVISDNDNQKHLLEVVHTTFDTSAYSVRLFPYKVTTLKKNEN